MLKRKPKTIVMTVAAQKGPYQDNGASPWHSMINVGTDPNLPDMRLNFDTDARFIWVTSTECNTVACMVSMKKEVEMKRPIAM